MFIDDSLGFLMELYYYAYSQAEKLFYHLSMNLSYHSNPFNNRPVGIW